MDDLDRTFARLKRVDFEILLAALKRVAGKNHYMLINPMTFEASLSKPYWHICAENGWTVDEFNFEYIFNDKK